jgi:phosphoribosylanthranilate isomerase
MTRIKVCGLTREGDVRRAVELGAAACGFVLSPSPRQVSPERAGELAAETADSLSVGVVTTEPAEWIAAAIAEADLGAVQLSAGADGPTVAAVREAAARRGLRPLVIAAADTPDAATADMLLLDARAPGVYGGSGATLDWAALALATPPPTTRLVVAGGLTARNVGQAIAALTPAMVDVCSGTEATPGVKDEAQLTGFFAAVAQADRSRGVAP